MKVDMHVHTNQSDGLYSPSDVASQFESSDLLIFVDHDIWTPSPGLLQGIEISSYSYGLREIVHILYYFTGRIPSSVDHLLNRTRSASRAWMLGYLASLSTLSTEQKERWSHEVLVGHPEVRMKIFRESGQQVNIENYLKMFPVGSSSAVPGFMFPSTTMVSDTLDAAGGVVILAHLLPEEFKVVKLEGHFDGLENSRRTVFDLSGFKRLPPLVTQGSDSHGDLGRSPGFDWEELPLKVQDSIQEIKRRLGC